VPKTVSDANLVTSGPALKGAPKSVIGSYANLTPEPNDSIKELLVLKFLFGRVT